MAGALRAFLLRDRIKPRDLQDLTGAAVAAVIGQTAPGAAGYAPSPHTLSSAHHTGLLASTQATQYAFNEGNGADDASDRSAYNSNRMTAGKAHVLPVLTDTYDIGSSTKWWKEMYVSQINAAIFAENVIQIVGGQQIIGHGQGTFKSAVATATTDIDFGTALAVDDFVLIKGHDTAGVIKTEYMKVTVLVSGTTYTVTRDVAAAHVTDPAWAIGTPWLNLGNTGDGRIESNAYGTPKIQLITQGTTYNAQTEVVRIGDLNDNWGYVAENYGIAMGDYAASKANVTIDPTNGIRLRNYATSLIQLQPDGDIFIGTDISAAATTNLIIFANAQTYNSEAGVFAAGDLLIGDNSASKANIWWDKSAGRLNFRGGTTTQFYIDTTGAFTAGAGAVTIDTDGLTLATPASTLTPNALKWKTGSIVDVGLYTYISGSEKHLFFDVPSLAANGSSVDFLVLSASTYKAEFLVTLRSGVGAIASLQIYSDSDASPATLCAITAVQTTITGGLNVGTATGAGTGDVFASGTLRTTGNINPNYVDANWYIGRSGTQPIINFDTGDYMAYDRTNNVLGFVIGSVGSLDLLANNRIRVKVFNTADGTAIAYYNGSGDLGVVSSDLRLKTDLLPIGGSLDIVKAIRGFTYRDIDDLDGPRRLGVGYQDVVAVLPEATFMVERGGLEYGSVHYEKLTALHNEAIKELAAIVEDQAIEIRALKARLEI